APAGRGEARLDAAPGIRRRPLRRQRARQQSDRIAGLAQRLEAALMPRLEKMRLGRITLGRIEDAQREEAGELLEFRAGHGSTSARRRESFSSASRPRVFTVPSASPVRAAIS